MQQSLYSYLAENLRNSIRCGLIYSTKSDFKALGHWQRNVDDDQEVDLISLAVPFPQSKCLNSEVTWRQWIDEISTQLEPHLLLSNDRLLP